MKDPTLRHQLVSYRESVVSGLTAATRSRAQAYDTQSGGLNLIGSSLAGIGDTLEEISSDLARLTAVVDDALPSIVEHLVVTAGELTKISKMIRVPKGTLAAEQASSGAKALLSAGMAESPDRAQRWYKLACRDLREAVRLNRYDAGAWFNLGIALALREKRKQAAKAFESSAFFSADKSPAFGATAVLLAAGHYRRAELPDESERLLLEYVVQLDRCAEIHFSLALHHNTPGALHRALELWPFLAADARQAGVIPQVEVVADSLCQGPEGIQTQLQQLNNAIQILVDAGVAAEIPGIRPIPRPKETPPSGVEALLVATAAWLDSLDEASRLMSRLTTMLHHLQHEGELIVLRSEETRSRISRGSASYTADASRAVKKRRQDIPWIAAQRTKIAVHQERIKREIETACREEERAIVERILLSNQRMEQIAAEAQMLAEAADLRWQKASAAVTEPLAILAAMVQDANAYSERIIPFNFPNP